MRLDTKRSKSEYGKSYFDSQIPESQSSVKTNLNNPKAKSVSSKASKDNVNKSFLPSEIPLLTLQKQKSKTLQENPEHSDNGSQKDWKSMHYDLLNNQFNKSKILERTEKAQSKAPSMRKKSNNHIALQPFTSDPAQLEFLPDLQMPKQKSISREQFDKRILLISTRNNNLNNKIEEIQCRFDRSYEANKLLLECQLKEVDSIKQKVIQKHEKEESKLRQKTKSFREAGSERESSVRSGSGSMRRNTIFSQSSQQAY